MSATDIDADILEARFSDERDVIARHVLDLAGSGPELVTIEGAYVDHPPAAITCHFDVVGRHSSLRV